MTEIYEDLDLPDGNAPLAEVVVRLAGAQGRPVLGKTISTNKAILGETVLRNGAGISSSGLWSLDLWPNADIAPTGTTWYVRRKCGCQVWESYITVPVTGGPYEAFTREDDPLGTITPSALGAHAADADLHGGGNELTHASITAAVTVTGTGGGLTVAAVPGLIITVPQVARPVYVWAKLPVLQTSGGPAEASYGIFPSGALGAFSALDAQQPPDIDTTNPRMTWLFARLAALSGGDYVVGGSGVGGNLTTRVSPSAISPARIWAVAA